MTVLEESPSDFTVQAHQKIGYMPQQFVLYPMLSVSENFNFSAALYGLGYFRRIDRRHKLLKFVELCD